MTGDPTLDAALEKLARTAKNTKAPPQDRRAAWVALQLETIDRTPAAQSPSWKRCIAFACLLAPLWAGAGATLAVLFVL
jgi:hypothetical protein